MIAVGSTSGDHPLYGQGSCAVCGCRIRHGLLMCGPHWRGVPGALQRQVYVALGRWESGEIVLRELWDVQDAAIDSLRGQRGVPR